MADEPTASLDEFNRKIVLHYLKKFAESGSTVIIVSHEKYMREFADERYDIETFK